MNDASDNLEPLPAAEPPTVDYALRKMPSWLARMLWALFIVLVVWAFCPRRINQGTVLFTCVKCGHKETYERVEAIPPKWLWFERYPGWNTREVLPASWAVECDHSWQVNTVAEMRGGKVSGSYNPGTDPRNTTFFNAIEAIPKNGFEIVEQLMAPKNTGITIGDAAAGTED